MIASRIPMPLPWALVTLPGSESVACAGGFHARCESSLCSCQCHPMLAHMAISQRLTIAQEERFDAFLQQVCGVLS